MTATKTPAPEGYAETLTSGKYFRLHAASVRSIIGYQPPARSDAYPKALAVLAKGAALSDRQAELVGAAVHAMAPFGPTAGEGVARMYAAVEKRLRSPWEDIIRKAGPEPGRPSDYTHEWTVADAAAIAVTLHEAARCYIPDTGIGWALAAVVEGEGVRTIEKVV